MAFEFELVVGRRRGGGGECEFKLRWGGKVTCCYCCTFKSFPQTFIHTYVHTYIYTYIHSYIHTYLSIHTYEYTYMHIMNTYIHKYGMINS